MSEVEKEKTAEKRRRWDSATPETKKSENL
jgi:hypothetical protein